MSIKETMISAALINTALLFTLFLTAAGGQNVQVQAGALDRFAISSADKNFYTHSKAQEETSTLPIQSAVDHSPAPVAHQQNSSEALPSVQSQKVEEKPLLSEPNEHLVQRGERLEQIAKLYGMTTEQLVACNELSSTQLKIGQKLKLSSTSRSEQKQPLAKVETEQKQAQNAEVYHYVKAGENPWTIAKKHKISLQRLLDLNNLDQKSAKKLKTGSKLRVQ